eukprot:SAG31_NODE_5058_length_2768_cov_1.632072_4_plen_74_part_00
MAPSSSRCSMASNTSSGSVLIMAAVADRAGPGACATMLDEGVALDDLRTLVLGTAGRPVAGSWQQRACERHKN